MSGSEGDVDAVHDRPIQPCDRLIDPDGENVAIEEDFIPRTISRSHSTGVDVLSRAENIVLRPLQSNFPNPQSGLLPSRLSVASSKSNHSTRTGTDAAASPEGYHSPNTVRH